MGAGPGLTERAPGPVKETLVPEDTARFEHLREGVATQPTAGDREKGRQEEQALREEEQAGLISACHNSLRGWRCAIRPSSICCRNANRETVEDEERSKKIPTEQQFRQR
eukprot:556915-Amphidinium_carterae.1